MRIWKTCQSAVSIVSNMLSMNCAGMSLWNKSLMEFTKIIRGRFHESGWFSRSGRSVRSNPPSIGVSGGPAESLGNALSVAVIAASRDFSAASYRVPGCVSPLDCRLVGHVQSSLQEYIILARFTNSCRLDFRNPQIRPMYEKPDALPTNILAWVARFSELIGED